MIKIKDGFNGERSIMFPKMVIELMEQVPLLSVLHITYIGFYPKALHHYRERNEPIDQNILIYCVDGTGWYCVGGGRYTVSSNQYFILPAGIPHVYATDDDNPWTIYWVHFKGSYAKYYIPHSLSPKSVHFSLSSRINERIQLFEEIFKAIDSGYSIPNLQYAVALFHHFLGSLSYIEQYRNAKSTKIDENNVVEVALHYMNENIEKQITLQEMADYTGYSPLHFATLFKAKIGTPPLKYLNTLRIQKACDMLDYTDLKLNQICCKVGIYDCFYFSRLFKKIMGISPKEYRRREKK